MESVGVANLPGTAGGTVVVGGRLALGGQLGPLGGKAIAVEVLGASHGSIRGDGVGNEDCVVGSVDVGVHTEAEEMLVVVCVDTWVDLGAPSLGVLIRVHDIGIEDTSQLDVRLDSTVLVEDPLDGVLVVGSSEDLLDDQLAGTGDNNRVVTEVGVLEEDTGILLVDADGVLDLADSTIAAGELGVKVVDCALAVAAQGETVGHVTSTILAEIESVLSLMGVLGVAAVELAMVSEWFFRPKAIVGFVTY